MLRGTVARNVGFVLLRFDGEGAICTTATSYRVAERWASGRRPSGTPRRDRQLVLSRLTVLVCRRGSSLAPTMGTRRGLRDLKALMKAAGIEVRDWTFPADLDSTPPEKDEELVGPMPEVEDVPAAEEDEGDAPDQAGG